MSVVIRSKRGKPKTWSTTAMWLVFGVAAVFFLVIYGQQLLLEHSLQDKISAQRVENKALEDVNTRLKAGLQYYQSDRYIEQRAREDLNLRRADEVVLIPIRPTQMPSNVSSASKPTPAAKSTPMPRTQPDEAPNWLRWLELFSPPSSSP
ncbi:MAG TPA: septum formation initiator family protein [Chloroflexia bacterium]|nr:septum formation initiator family protein [Chloroflexia bacterium]